MRSIRLVLYLFGYLLFHPFALRKGLRALETGDDAAVDAIAEKHVPRWCNGVLKRTGIQVQITGQENIPKDRPCVFVANHRSMVDVLMMLTQFGNMSLIAKIETNKIPLIRSWMKLLHCQFLDRKDPRQSMKVIGAATDLVKQGYNVGIFPEGTRSKGEEGELLPFMAGAFRIASGSKAPIVPVVMFRTRECLEGDGHFTIKPGTVTIHVLPAVETKDLSRAELKELPSQIQTMIQNDLTEGLKAGI